LNVIVLSYHSSGSEYDFAYILQISTPFD